MDLLEQLRGNFPKTIDKSNPVFSSLIANDEHNAAIQEQLEDLFNYMKEWISTPNVYNQTGVMLDKTVSFFSFLERYADETEQSLKNRFAAIFIRNHDTRWGTAFDVKSVFKQYFPSAKIYLVENTNKIDDATPEFANLLSDGDIDTDTPTAWTLTDCDATSAARFSKAYGIEMNQSGGHFEQTVTVLNRKKINDTEPYQYKNLAYFLHFFLSGRVKVRIYNSANSMYWDNENKAWSSSAVDNLFEKSEWNDCSLYFLTEGDDDNTDITVSFYYESDPVVSELENAALNGKVPVTWTLDNCTETDGVIELSQSDASVYTTADVIPETTYKLGFGLMGEVTVTIMNDNGKYWDVTDKIWRESSVSYLVRSAEWEDKIFDIIPESGDANITVTFDYEDDTAYLRNTFISGQLVTQETLTDCTKAYNVITMDQMSSVASYTADVSPLANYSLDFKFKGRTSIVIQNDNSEYWDITANKWSSAEVRNDLFSDNKVVHTINIDANADTTELTISYEIPNSYLDYFRLFEKQPYGSFTVMAYFEGNTSMGVFGLAAGDADPNIATEEATPPQPRYGNYGYYDKSYLSGVPIGFASDIYEDLLDYLRAQGVKAYLEIVIKDYSESE